MNVNYTEKAGNYVIANARYYERGIPPTGGHYGVSYKGRGLVSDDIAELAQKLQARMEAEEERK